MADLFVPLYVAGTFLGLWILDVFKPPKLFVIAYALLVVALGCVGLLGIIHLEVPKAWGAPAADILVLGGMIGAARLVLHGVLTFRSVLR